jgi:hypothetical protein
MFEGFLKKQVRVNHIGASDTEQFAIEFAREAWLACEEEWCAVIKEANEWWMRYCTPHHLDKSAIEHLREAGVDVEGLTPQKSMPELIAEAELEMRDACLRAAKRGFNSKSKESRKKCVYDRINAVPIEAPASTPGGDER